MNNSNTINPKDHGLAQDEFDRIKGILGREPNLTEVGMIGAMWSEHCSYKSSRLHLKTLPTSGKNVLEGPGENAGVIDIGDGLAVVFKVESHNHPSFIEPYQGAATGVGGILRDVFTMGARPLANLDCLRLGAVGHPKTPHLLSGVVAGVGGYGNCVGVPTISGETTFHDCFNGNILVNAFTLGLVKSNRYFKAKAAGVGNPIFYVGSRTGRDGIHGATMASDVFDSENEEAKAKRPTVQVGDPFTEKLLIEACLELMASDVIVAIQDMGAAGLTSSSFEMAGRGGLGVRMNLDKIPTREDGMTPYELMLSESQERMLLIAKKGCEKTVRDIFVRWGLQVAEVGEVTNTGHVELTFHGEIVANLPVGPLTDTAPLYDRPSKIPAYLHHVQGAIDPSHYQFSLRDDMLKLIAAPNLCAKHWVFEQYDSMVRTNTLLGPGQAQAGVIRIKESKKEEVEKAVAIAAKVNPRRVYLHPRLGTQHALAAAQRHLACVGARALGVTNCLNFGNPENPEVMWQLKESIGGLKEACTAFEIPVVSGNVSLYNETDGEQIFPTPQLVLVGLLDDARATQSHAFKAANDLLYVVGAGRPTLDGSEYLAYRHGVEKGQIQELDFNQERLLCDFVISNIESRVVRSARSIDEGGLFYAVCRSAFSTKDLAAHIDLTDMPKTLRQSELWFGESAGRFLISIDPLQKSAFEQLAAKKDVAIRPIGQVLAGDFKFADPQEQMIIRRDELMAAWSKSLETYMENGQWPQ